MLYIDTPGNLNVYAGGITGHNTINGQIIGCVNNGIVTGSGGTYKIIAGKDDSTINVFDGGDGINTPFEISSYYQLKIMSDFADDPTLSFVLTQDIEIPEYESWKPISHFTGNFDGGGNKIWGLHFSSNDEAESNATTYYGAFCILNSGTISNLDIEAELWIADLTSSYVYVGVFAGQNEGTIEFCNSYGPDNGEMIFVYTLGSMMYSSNVIDVYAGGITGHNFNLINTCVNFGSISGMRIVPWTNDEGTIGYDETDITRGSSGGSGKVKVYQSINAYMQVRGTTPSKSQLKLERWLNAVQQRLQQRQ